MFDFLPLPGHEFPLFFVARTEKLSETEVRVSVLDDIHVESVENALKKANLKLEISRHFRDIQVRVLEKDLVYAKSRIESLVSQAKEEVESVLLEPIPEPFSQSKRLHFFLIDLRAAAKLKELE